MVIGAGRQQGRFWSRLILVLLLGFGLVPTGWAWGGLGHRLVARVAASRVSPATRERIAQLLEGQEMADVSLWADRIKHDRPETATWHYLSFPRATETDEGGSPDLSGSNTVSALRELTRLLREPGRSDSERQEALQFLIHLVGDLHQPMHCAPDGDQGGNAVAVVFFGQDSNLHKVWDSGLTKGLDGSDDEIVAALGTAWGASAPSDGALAEFPLWAAESNQLARWHAYQIPTDHQLDDRYVAANLRVCSRQIWKAGVRLADLLDSLFDQGAGPSAPIQSLPVAMAMPMGGANVALR